MSTEVKIGDWVRRTLLQSPHSKQADIFTGQEWSFGQVTNILDRTMHGFPISVHLYCKCMVPTGDQQRRWAADECIPIPDDELEVLKERHKVCESFVL